MVSKFKQNLGLCAFYRLRMEGWKILNWTCIKYFRFFNCKIEMVHTFGIIQLLSKNNASGETSTWNSIINTLIFLLK